MEGGVHGPESVVGRQQNGTALDNRYSILIE
jgi:hypothetical protein